MSEGYREPVLEFNIVTEQGFPWGVRCSECYRIIPNGTPYKSVEDGMYENGDVLAVIMCVYCPEDAV